jgi:hypothetical protein
MYGLIDLTGRKFGRLTVIRRARENQHRHSTWVCRCKCGNVVTIRGTLLRNHITRSCGCLAAQKSAQRSKARAKARRAACKNAAF